MPNYMTTCHIVHSKVAVCIHHYYYSIVWLWKCCTQFCAQFLDGCIVWSLFYWKVYPAPCRSPHPPPPTHPVTKSHNYSFYRCTASSPGIAPLIFECGTQWVVGLVSMVPWGCGNFIRSLPIKPRAPFFFSPSQRRLGTRQTGVNLPIHIDLMGCWSIRGFSTSIYGQWAHFHLFSFAGYVPSFLGSNIKAVEWLPQNDLLAHKDIKAFVSHIGQNSLYESAYHGVPVVAFPLFVDQFFNARKVEHFGLGVSVDHSNFDTEQLVEKIEHVINEPRYC